MSDWRKKMQMETEPEGTPFRSPVFVIGCMRSGTTFLADKLTQHPQLLKVGNELRDVWTDIGGAPCSGGSSVARSANDASVEVVANMTNYFSTFVAEAKSARRHVMRVKNRLLRKQGRVFYDWHDVYPVNKSTQLVNKIGYVHALFPDSKLVVIVRDIEGHSASMKAFIDHNYAQDSLIHQFPNDQTSAWSRLKREELPTGGGENKMYPTDFSAIPEMWLRLNLQALRVLKSLPASEYRLVRYEDLVSNQEHSFSQILSFLSLDARHQKHEKELSTSRMTFMNTTTDGDPLLKWKNQLTDSELNVIEEIKKRDEYSQVGDLLDRLSIG